MFLGDMQTCVEKIQSYTAGMTLVSFSANRLVMAATNIPPNVRSQFAIVHWREIVDTRNKLIHGYAGLDDEIVSDIVSNDIPRLKTLLAEMSKRAG